MDLTITVTQEDIALARTAAKNGYGPAQHCAIAQALKRLFNPSYLMIGSTLVFLNDRIFEDHTSAKTKHLYNYEFTQPPTTFTFTEVKQ